MITNIRGRHSQCTVLALALTALACGSAPEEGSTAAVRLQGTELSIVAGDDTLLAGPDMVGVELELISGKRLTIASYERDAFDSELAWYVLTHEGANICGGDTRGMFLPGLWDETGAHVFDKTPAEVAPLTFSCSTTLEQAKSLGATIASFSDKSPRLLCRVPVRY